MGLDEIKRRSDSIRNESRVISLEAHFMADNYYGKITLIILNSKFVNIQFIKISETNFNTAATICS
jgi:hypothetical protein